MKISTRIIAKLLLIAFFIEFNCVSFKSNLDPTKRIAQYKAEYVNSAEPLSQDKKVMLNLFIDVLQFVFSAKTFAIPYEKIIAIRYTVDNKRMPIMGNPATPFYWRQNPYILTLPKLVGIALSCLLLYSVLEVLLNNMIEKRIAFEIHYYYNDIASWISLRMRKSKFKEFRMILKMKTGLDVQSE